MSFLHCSLYEAYQLYLSGKWMELIGKINAIEEDDYLDYDSESPLKHLAVQLKHFALVQVCTLFSTLP